MDKVLGVILAGGTGKRLYPLTATQAKPAVSFAGQYRLIDFALSNLLNSDIRHWLILTQYKPDTLHQHLKSVWQPLLPADGTMQIRQAVQPGLYYQGTAGAVRQNLPAIMAKAPTAVVIISADHIYKMDYRQMMTFHCQHHADLTIAAVNIPARQAKHFGIISTDNDNRMTAFCEKPKTEAHCTGYKLASMGNYIFTPECLLQALEKPGADFGHDILPQLHQHYSVYAYPFNQQPKTVRHTFWRDVGTLDSYYQTQLDIMQQPSLLRLNDPSWPIYSAPADKYLSRISVSARITDSVISSGCRIGQYCRITGCILAEQVHIGSGCNISKAIIGRNTLIAPGTKISPACAALFPGISCTQQGVVIIPEGSRIGFDWQPVQSNRLALPYYPLR